MNWRKVLDFIAGALLAVVVVSALATLLYATIVTSRI